MLELVVVVEGLPFGVEDGVEAIVEVAEAEAGGDDMMHWLLLQLKPNGQHWLPQDGSVPSNCVVKSSLWGLVAAFCLERSQLSGDMVEQSRPVGQHIAELLSLKATHCVSDGQQKLPGRPEWLQAVVFDCAQRQCLYSPKSQRRRLHHVPQLTNDEHYLQHGVGRMLTPDSYEFAWHQYEGWLIDRLNRLTTGTKEENKMTKDLVIAHSRSPTSASLFNHASMAYNNHSFFAGLSPDPSPMSDSLKRTISNSFSSPESLRATFIATANAMFGPGFVWLVKRKNVNPASIAVEPELSILTTYIAGSPLPGAHSRRQEDDKNTAVNNTAGAFGIYSGFESKLAPGGADLEELLCVNTWQHVWLRDWGFGGKKGFLEAWWDVIDWEIVERRLGDMSGGRRLGRRNELPRVGRTRR
ncbi:hypothetical protein MMC28_006217 [Mycoblastus sanguinarius]|nr:hypothetical protein [Mycoblastus sanguinarius]